MKRKTASKRQSGTQSDFHLKEHPLPADLQKTRFANFESRRFKVRGMIDGWNQGKRLIVERKKAWVDLEVEGQSDIVTDFRLHSSTLGQNEALFFGFAYFNEDFVLIPSPTEIINSLSAFNQGLSETDSRRIRTSFVRAKVESSAHRQYVTRFFSNGSLPLSLSGRQMFHDIVSHGLHGFYVNNEMFDALARKHLLWKKFSSLHRRRFLIDEATLFRNMESSLYRELAYDLDTTSNITFDFIPRYKLSNLIHDNIRRLPEKIGTAARGIPETLMDSSRHGLSSTRFFDIWLDQFNENLRRKSNPVATALQTYLKREFERDPSLDDGLSFDLQADIRALRAAMKIPGQTEREMALNKILLAKPFVERLRHVRKLLRRPRPNFGKLRTVF